MIVRARSPYIIFINEVGQTSGKLELRIWKNGETKPTLPTYSFTKSIPSPTQTLLRFNISPYLKDFISNLLYDVNTWYCNFECRIFSNDVELTPQKIDGIAVNGYTTFLQGQNATAQDLKNSIDNLQIGGRNLITKLPKEKSYPAISFWDYFPLSEKLKEGETYILNGTVENVGGFITIGLNNLNGINNYFINLPINTPFVANNEMANRTHFSIANQTGVGTSIFKRFKLEKGNKATDWTPAPEDKQDMFSDIKRQIKVGSTNKLHYYDIVLNEISEITATNIEETCEPILEPQLVQFINRYGGLDFIWFFKMRTDNISIESKEYKLLQQGIGYDTTIGQNAKYNFNGKQSVKMNTGFVNENYNELIQDLMLSEKVWINSIPAIVKSSGTEFKTQIRNKNINYEIEFEYAFDLINNMQ